MQVRQISPVNNCSDEVFAALVERNNSIGDILVDLGLEKKGSYYKAVWARIKRNKLAHAHVFHGKGSNIQHGLKYPTEDMLVVNSPYARRDVKRRILREGLLPYCCSVCGNSGDWNDLPLILQLEHQNGVANDHRLENLCFLCPNCHSQTETFSGRNLRKPQGSICACGNLISRDAKVCPTCSGLAKREIPRPDKDSLATQIWEHPTSALAKIYGVSDTAIANWCKEYGISKPPRGYWTGK